MSGSFNGTTSMLVYPCPEAMNDACCIFILLKNTDTVDTTWHSYFQFDVDATAGAATRASFGRRSTGYNYYGNSVGLNDSATMTADDSDGWCRYWVSRSAAAATTFGKASIGTTTPTTQAGGALADGLTNAGGVVKIGGDDDPFLGKVAAFAWWDGTPPSDAALAAVVSTAGLLALSPTRCYDATDLFVNDLVGANDQTTNTAVTTDGADNPSGWTYFGAGVQKAYAVSDSVDGTWTDNAAGTALAAAIDETAFSDADYIQSVLGPVNSGCRVKAFDTALLPQAGTRILHWRTGKDATGGPQIDMTIKLYQGGGNSQGAGTLVDTFTRNNVDAATTYDETITGTVTNYADLYVEFYANQV